MDRRSILNILRGLSLLVVAVLSLFMVACEGEEGAVSSPGGQGRIEGQIFMPLESARLYVYKPGMDLYGPAFAMSSPADRDGGFSIDLPDGEYVVVARKRTDDAESGPIVAGDNRSEFMDVKVQGGVLDMQIAAPIKIGDDRRFTGDAEVSETGLSGRVLDSDGQPVKDARVHVYDHVQMSERPKFVSGKTGPDGYYQVYLPEGGTYYLAARDKFGGPPKLGDLYGRYDKGTIEPSAVIIEEGSLLQDVNITVTKVW